MHTPGPWHYIRGAANPFDDDEAEAGFTIVLQDEPLGSVYDSHLEIRYMDTLYPEDGDMHKEAEANASLIAAAPEMLEILEIIASGVNIITGDRIRNLIAKARGD